MSKVSFDFDNTLTVMRFNPDDGIFCDFHGPNLVMIQCMHAHVKNGNEVHVITSRNESVASKTEIMRLLANNPDEIAALPPSCDGILVKNGCVDAEGVVCDPLEPRFMFPNEG